MRRFIFAVVVYLSLFSLSAAQKPKTERELEGLKGLVRTIRVERASLIDRSGNRVDGELVPVEQGSYDITGNLVKYVGYDYRGNIDRVNEYFYIDGDKVSKDTNIQHDYNPPPAAGSGDQTDAKYTRKYKYKYDAKGNVEEKHVYRNDGSLIVKQVNKFDDRGNKIETIITRSDGKVNFHARYGYDSAGNQTEETQISETGSVRSNCTYTYEFDKAGNWIKRVAHIVMPKDGKIVQTPAEVTYRTIAYFEEIGDNSSVVSENVNFKDIVRPKLLNNPRPFYTPEAIRNAIEGIVKLRVLVEEDGLVERVLLVAPGLPDGLNEEAIRTARRMKFKPATIKGKPLKYWVPVEIEFRL